MSGAIWQLGGWTMVHFLWIGAIVAVAGGLVRLACRRVAPAVRYAVSLMTLATLAATPIALGGWLALDSPAILAGRDNLAQRNAPISTETPSQDGSAIYQAPPMVVDLAFSDAAEAAGDESLEPANAAPLKTGAVANPSPRPSAPRPLYDLRGRGMTVATYVAYLPWVWLIGAPITFGLLAAGLVGSERLRRTSTALASGAAVEACERLRRAMRITRRVSVAVCDGIAQPVLVGIVRPLILLPAAAMSGWTPEELEMVLVHELAHVRRWDNLVNLAQRVIESLLFFHPAVWLVSGALRRDREECCDAAVVAHTERPHQYAELLVAIAAKMQSPRPVALAMASAMADHPLAGRVRRILKLEDEQMWISQRTLGLTLGLPALLLAAVIYSGAAAEDPPPSKGGARGGIEIANSASIPDAPANDAKRTVDEDHVSAKDVIDVQVELPRLRAEIGRLEKLIAEEEKTLADLEIYKQLSMQSPRGSATLERAIATTLEQDPTIAVNQQKLSTLQEAIQQRQATTRNPNDSQLKQLVAKMGQTQQETQLYRAGAEKAARERLKTTMSDKKLQPWRAEYQIRFEAATEALEKYQQELSEARLRLTTAAPAHDRKSAAIEHEVDMPTLRAEVARLERLIAEGQQDLANIELFKQLALQEARSPAALEQAIAASLEKDPTLHDYQDKLHVLRAAIERRKSQTRNPSDLMLRQLGKQVEHTELMMQQYRAQAEKVAREQIAKMPNEAFRAALVEHKIRFTAATEALEKYQQELSEARLLLVMDDVLSDPAKIKAVFTVSEENPAQAITYNVDAFTQYPGQFSDMLEGWQKDPFGPQLNIEWKWIEKDKVIEIKAAQKSHTFFGALISELERLATAAKTTRPEDEADAKSVKVYPVGDLAMVKFHHWMRLISSDKSIEIQWFDKNHSIVVTAPESRHKEIANFFSHSRDDISRAQGGPIEVEERVTDSNRAELSKHLKAEGGLRVFQLKHARASMVNLNLEEFFANEAAAGGSPAPRFIWDSDTNTIVVQGATEQQVKDVHNLVTVYDQPRQAPGGEARLARLRDKIKQMRDLFEDSPENPVKTVNYATNKARREFNDHWQYLIAGLENHTGSRNYPLAWNRKQGGKEVEVTAPIEAHKELFEPMFSGVDLLKGESAEHRLRPGDQVKIRVVGAFPEAPIDDAFVIEPAGTVALGPTYGRAAVAGLTLLEAEEAVKTFLADILTDVQVQITLSPPPKPSERSARTVSAVIGAEGKKVEYLYDGKTFDQWRDLWMSELKTQRRTEAIEAFAAFARAGRAKEAAEAILEVAGEYDFSRSWMDEASPEALLRKAIAAALNPNGKIPATLWLPLMHERIAKDPQQWLPMLEMIFREGGYQVDPTTRDALLAMASEKGPNAAYLRVLHSAGLRDEPQVQELTKAALTGDDGDNALSMLEYVDLMNLEDAPERLAPFFHKDPEIRRRARTHLAGHSSFHPTAIATYALNVLDDPQRSQDHVDALRLISAMRMSNRGMATSLSNTSKKLDDKFESLIKEGPPELLPAVLVASGRPVEPAVQEWLSSRNDQVSEERRALLLDVGEALEKEVQRVADPRQDGGGMGGGGGGFF